MYRINVEYQSQNWIQVGSGEGVDIQCEKLVLAKSSVQSNVRTFSNLEKSDLSSLFLCSIPV